MAARIILVALALVAAFPAAAGSRTSDAAPNSDYSLTADAFVRPDRTDLFVRVAGTPAPTRLEKLQVKIWPRAGGEVETTNLFDVAVTGGVATLSLPRLALLQRIDVQAHVKQGSQNVLRDDALVEYEQLGAVSSDHPLATEVGAKVLRNGGNAFDAAAAMTFVLSVVQPSLAGIGGAVEAVVHVSDERRDYAIVGRETAPADTQPTMYDDQVPPNASLEQIAAAQFRVGLNGYSVGVPGAVRSIEEMLERWGTTSLSDAVEPAIGYAEDGFPVGAFLRNQVVLGRTRLLQPETVARFGSLQRGDLLVQKDLAETLRLIGRGGSAAFYRGPVAEAIVRAQRTIGVGPNAIPQGAGRMTLADLAAYDVVIRPASQLDYKGYDVLGAPAPSNGGQIVLETLGLLEQRFPIGDVAAGYGFGTRNTIHAMVESLRLAFADRDMWIGDPAMFAVPEGQLLSDEYLRERASLLSPFPVRMTPNTPVPPGDPLGFDADAHDESTGHTTHLSVVDRFGNTVSLTATVRDAFGSGILVEPYGFLLNDSLSLFNIPSRRAPDPGANNAAPGKRPMGSQSPILITRDGEPVAATGTFGAEFIPSLTLNIVLDLIDHKLDLQQAVDSSRIWGRTSNGVYAWAPGFRSGRSIPIEEIIALRALGPPRPALNPPAGDRVFGSLASVGVDPATFALEAAADDMRQADAKAVVVGR